MRKNSVAVVVLLLAVAAEMAGQGTASTAKSMRDDFAGVNQKVLTMAKDFPEDKYTFKLKPEMRSFGDVIVHIASGNIYAAKAGRGEKVKWDEADPKNYKNKAEIVAMLEKSINDADATFKNVSDASLAKNIEPWLDVMEHTAEHYGMLVTYYRANGLVPPESRPK
jgi:uncharacterized damage-inducible protein DinB